MPCKPDFKNRTPQEKRRMKRMEFGDGCPLSA